MKKRVMFLAASLGALCLMSACGGGRDAPPPGPEKSDPVPYYSWSYPALGEETMPIGAWCAPPASAFANLGNPSYITEENYRRVAESGLNSIYALYDVLPDKSPEVMKAMEYAAKFNMVYLARDYRTANAIEDAEIFARNIQSYQDNPGFGGWLAYDEPGTAHFDDLAAIRGTMERLAPEKLMYTNMLPTYASDNQLVNGAGGGSRPSEGITYEKYLDSYLAKVKPEIFSYDYYGLAGAFPSVTDGYFEQMSVVRKKTLAAKIPFWTFVQSCSFNANMRIPTQEEIDWQVSTSLAYGAKGIQYFTYWTPIEATSEVFRGCMVSKTGEIQPTYYFAQRANRQIAAVDAVLMKAASLGVMTAGETPAPIPEADRLRAFRELAGVGGKSALVGCFDWGGRTALYVVNNCLLAEERTVELTFTGSVTGTCVQNGAEREFSGAALALTLAGGEGVLVTLDNQEG